MCHRLNHATDQLRATKGFAGSLVAGSNNEISRHDRGQSDTNLRQIHPNLKGGLDTTSLGRITSLIDQFFDLRTMAAAIGHGYALHGSIIPPVERTRSPRLGLILPAVLKPELRNRRRARKGFEGGLPHPIRINLSGAFH
jgi:hypothetical protein